MNKALTILCLSIAFNAQACPFADTVTVATHKAQSQLIALNNQYEQGLARLGTPEEEVQDCENESFEFFPSEKTQERELLRNTHRLLKDILQKKTTHEIDAPALVAAVSPIANWYTKKEAHIKDIAHQEDAKIKASLKPGEHQFRDAGDFYIFRHYNSDIYEAVTKLANEVLLEAQIR